MYRPIWIIQAVATELHRIQCRQDHTEVCSWEYGTWGETSTYAHREYCERADRALQRAEEQGIEPQTVLDVLSIT